MVRIPIVSVLGRLKQQGLPLEANLDIQQNCLQDKSFHGLTLDSASRIDGHQESGSFWARRGFVS